MDQQKHSRWRITRRQVLWTIAILAVLTVAVLIGYRYGITLWDWIKLLIVPTVIAGGGLWFNRQQREREVEIAERRTQDEALQAYLDQMADMLIPNKDQPSLYKARPGDSLSSVARARTLTVLPRLDGDRKARVVQFLYEAGLIVRDRPILSLGGADLSGASFTDVTLSGVSLRGADLRRSQLSGANLSAADLRDAILSDSNLQDANLKAADLRNTVLSDSNLRKADLRKADLRKADLRAAHPYGANLGATDLRGAKLRQVDFLGVIVSTTTRLSGADLTRASRLPDLSQVDLRGANHSEADLGSAREADLRGANLYRADLFTSDLNQADLREANLYETNLGHSNLSEANLSKANLSHAKLDYRTNLTNADLRGAFKYSYIEVGPYMPGGSSGSGIPDPGRQDTKTIETLIDHNDLAKMGKVDADKLKGATMPDGRTYEEWLTTLPPGRYDTKVFEPALSFSVSDGWRLAQPESTDVLLIWTGPDGGQLIFNSPLQVFDPSNPIEPKEVPAPENADEWASWFQRHPNLDTSAPVSVAVVDTPGMRIDATGIFVPEYHPPDFCGEQPCIPLYPGVGSLKGWKDRVVMVDVEGATMLIDVCAPKDKFDEFAPEAHKVLDTLAWESG